MDAKDYASRCNDAPGEAQTDGAARLKKYGGWRVQDEPYIRAEVRYQQTLGIALWGARNALPATQIIRRHATGSTSGIQGWNMHVDVFIQPVLTQLDTMLDNLQRDLDRVKAKLDMIPIERKGASVTKLCVKIRAHWDRLEAAIQQNSEFELREAVLSFGQMDIYSKRLHDLVVFGDQLHRRGEGYGKDIRQIYQSKLSTPHSYSDYGNEEFEADLKRWYEFFVSTSRLCLAMHLTYRRYRRSEMEIQDDIDLDHIAKRYDKMDQELEEAIMGSDYIARKREPVGNSTPSVFEVIFSIIFLYFLVIGVLKAVELCQWLAH